MKSFAEMFAVVKLSTPVVFTVNVTVNCPVGTEIVCGTTADLLALEREIASPPVAAGLEIVRVPVELFPPETFDGSRVSEIKLGGLIVRLACWSTPGVAVMTA